MKHYQAGNSSILAEIIVDYDKKKIDMRDPINRFKLTDKDWDFSLGLIGMIGAMQFIIFVGFFAILDQIALALILAGVGLFFYIGKVVLVPVSIKFHQVEQYLFNDRFATKKYLLVKEIDSKIWKLPYDFENMKLDWYLYGDFKKYIQKVHIKPKDYKLFRGMDRKKAERQDQDWEAVFYFKEVPKEGKMEVVWI
jgi:hypothetical protein